MTARPNGALHRGRRQPSLASMNETVTHASSPPAERRVRGGKAIYGARIGILMLDSRFPRIPGDTGNALTWPFPVRYKVVRGATPDLVVRRGAAGTFEAFAAAAEELVADGVDGITTTCGFLSLFQADLSARLRVPVLTSTLMQVALVDRILPPGRRTGVISVSAATLTRDHLIGAGAPADTPVVGTENGAEFTRAILGDALELDCAQAEADILEAGDRLVAAHPEVGAVVLECTNMVPYARALSEHIGLPVYDMYAITCWFQHGLSPRDFGPPGSGGRPWRER